ncbi:MAG: phage major capsid protein [Candidatus Coproplasma sp.]
MVTIQKAENILKDYYLDAVIAQLNGEISPFYNAIAKTSENVYGREARIAVSNGFSNAVKACEEDGDLPSPKTNRYYYINGPLKNIYGTIEISDKLLRASSDSSGTCVNMLNSEMEGLIGDAKSNFSRMLYGDGNGKLTTVKSKISSYVLEVEDVKPYFLGMEISIELSSKTVNTKINKINRTDSTITVTDKLDSYTFSGGEKISVRDAEDMELKGLGSIFEGTYLYGYNKSNEPFFNPYVKSVVKSELSIADLVTAMDDVEEASGSKINMILCSYKTRRMISNLFDNSRQFVNTTDIQGGVTSLYVNGIPVYADTYCPENAIYLLNTDDFVLCQLCDWSWLEDEGGRVLKQVAGKASYSATLVKYAELFCKRPCGQALIKLTEE